MKIVGYIIGGILIVVMIWFIVTGVIDLVKTIKARIKSKKEKENIVDDNNEERKED
jgi:uncharacterized membrane protein YkvI